MRVSLAKGYTYIPVWNGNRSQPPGEQIEVDVEYINGAVLSAIYESRPQKDEKKYEEDQGYQARYDKALQQFYVKDFTSYTKAVRNLIVEDEKGKEVVCGQEDIVTNPGFMDLYTECKLEYARRSAVVKKNRSRRMGRAPGTE